MGMKKPLIGAICATMLLASCGAVSNSRLNPFNWFGNSPEGAVVVVSGETGEIVDQRPLVATVTEMAIEQMPGGVIIRATGLPPTQGHWDAELVARPVEDGVLVYDFRLVPPPSPASVSTPQSREVIVASFLSTIKLEGVRQITVQGASNARTSRR
jgi:hypothetical protein